MLIALHKPMNVLSQFTPEGRWPGLAGLGLPGGVYAAGRLDRDSEGLLLLTDDGRLQARIARPAAKLPKTYLAQVEGPPDAAAAARLVAGVALKDGPARAAAAEIVPDPGLPPRDPPVRVRRTVPDHWLRIVLTEGRNRQVRRMTAAAGRPTLRLVRVAIGPWRLGDLAPGEWRAVEAAALSRGGADPMRRGP